MAQPPEHLYLMQQPNIPLYMSLINSGVGGNSSLLSGSPSRGWPPHIASDSASVSSITMLNCNLPKLLLHRQSNGRGLSSARHLSQTHFFARRIVYAKKAWIEANPRQVQQKARLLNELKIGQLLAGIDQARFDPRHGLASRELWQSLLRLIQHICRDNGSPEPFAGAPVIGLADAVELELSASSVLQHKIKSFQRYGGVQILRDLLLRDMMCYGFISRSHCGANSATAAAPYSGEKLDLYLKNKKMVLDICCRLVNIRNRGEEIAILLANDEVFLQLLFMFLSFRVVYHGAVQLLEDLFQVRQNVYVLHNIRFLAPMMIKMTDSQLLTFMRILSLTLSDMDLYTDRSSLYAQNRQKRAQGFVNIRDVNQEMLMTVPGFLPRLVELLRRVAQQALPRYPAKHNESDNWLTWIEQCLVSNSSSTTVSSSTASNDVTMSSAVASNRHFSLDRCHELNNLVHVCYVLGLFLSGRQRRRVQKRLAELHMAEVLRDVFSRFLWRCHDSGQPPRLPPVMGAVHALRNGQQCECAPEVAVKIQVLRLIHSFCDHADWQHRRLLLSRNELREMRRLNASLPVELRVQGLNDIPRHLMCRGNKGLLVDIAEVLQREPPESTFRFWLARAVESYLRSQSAYCDQMLLVRRGVLHHIVRCMLESERPPKEVVQSCFDLLAELVKFNAAAICVLDELLSSMADGQRLFELAERHLVDSNMFLRSLLLTIDHFVSGGGEQRDLAELHSVSLTRYCSEDKQVAVAYKMFRLLELHELTQENVSCLNTGLVVLLYGRRRGGGLPHILAKLAAVDTLSERLAVKPDLTPQQVCSLKPIMENLGELLCFWIDHYLNKDKDCSALEKSSRISFDEWKRIVAVLVDEDVSNPSSVRYYTERNVNCVRPAANKLRQLQEMALQADT